MPKAPPAPEAPKAPPAPEAPKDLIPSSSLYGYGPKDQASREPGTCRFLCLNSDLEGKEKQWLKRLASSKVLEEDVSRTYGKPGGPASPAPRFTLRIHPFSGGRDSSGSIPFE